jgi:purine-binding chemotaxis protein CheW
MTIGQEAQATDVLLARIGTRLAAIPVRDVIEVLRPLSVQRIEGAPPFVAGLAVLRGTPTPVVDLRVLLGAPTDTPASRWVSTQLQERRVALAVDAVVGTRALAADALGRLPALLEGGASDAVASLGVLDRQLLVLLQASRSFLDAVDAAAGPAPRL